MADTALPFHIAALLPGEPVLSHATYGPMVQLRGVVLLMLRAKTPAARAARRLIDVVYRAWRFGQLRASAADLAVVPGGDRAKATIFELWLKGQLVPADAKVTMAIDDACERLQCDRPLVMSMIGQLREICSTRDT
jgi:hypothetical protein